MTYEEIVSIACKGLRGSVPTHYTAQGVVDALIEGGVIEVTSALPEGKHLTSPALEEQIERLMK